MTKLIITGSKGRMGQMLVACASRNPDLQVVGQIEEQFRLPLVPITAKSREALRATMKKCGLLK